MKRIKKLVALLTVLGVIMVMKINSYACSPLYDVDMPEIPEIKVELSDEMKVAIDKAVEEKIKENLEIKFLTMPELIEATYRHSTCRFLPDILMIRWEAVKEATSYDIKLTSPDGTEKTYSSEYNTLILLNDDSETESLCHYSVSIRAVKDDGALYSLWTEKEDISCNTNH